MEFFLIFAGSLIFLVNLILIVRIILNLFLIRKEEKQQVAEKLEKHFRIADNQAVTKNTYVVHMLLTMI